MQDTLVIFIANLNLWPTAMSAWSKALVCSRSLSGIAGSNPAGDMDVCLSVVSVVCFLVEVCVYG